MNDLTPINDKYVQGFIYNHIVKLLIPFLALIFAAQVQAENQALADLFAQEHIEGAIVISSLRSKQSFIHNNLIANQKFPVASTFKILNTLIAIEENVVSGKEAAFKWDGHIYDIPEWNHDQTLASAFKVSCVWCFQQIARQVGIEKYRSYLNQLGYGELHEPFKETTFWLDGSLEISAIEQVNFLKKVYLQSLPFSTSAYETLREIMLVEQTPMFTIRAKSGWAGRVSPQTGWYVGYVETPKDVWFFATTIEDLNKQDLPLRQKLTREALQTMGVIQ
jgi:beta-lactamase class D